MKRRPYRRGHRLAPLCNAAGEQIDVADVLDEQERLARRWGTPEPHQAITGGRELVARVADLQKGARS